MKLKLISFLLIITAAAVLSAETRTYNGTDGRAVYTITPNGNGYIIKTSSHMGKVTTHVNSSFETQKWRFSNASENTDISAYLENGVIYVSGTYKGKQIEKENKTDGLVWHQNFPVEMEKAAANGVQSMKFIALAPSGPMVGRPGKFSAKRIGDETITVNGKSVAAVKYKFAVVPFWSCHIWYRKSDGKYIKYEDGNNEAVLQE